MKSGMDTEQNEIKLLGKIIRNFTFNSTETIYNCSCFQRLALFGACLSYPTFDKSEVYQKLHALRECTREHNDLNVLQLWYSVYTMSVKSIRKSLKLRPHVQ